MQKIKILIVEDEAIIADDLRYILEDFDYAVTDFAVGYTEAIAALTREKPDLVLLDITIRGEKDGIDLAAFINKNYRIPFIFLTSHGDKSTIERAKATLPYGYLIKPFESDDVFAAIEMALGRFAATPNDDDSAVEKTEKVAQNDAEKLPFFLDNAIFVRHKSIFQKIPFDDILFLEADSNYTKIHTTKQAFMLRNTMKFIGEKLPEQFFRVHKSFIINCKNLTGFDNSSVYFGDKYVPVGRSFSDGLMHKFNILSSEKGE